MKGIDVANLKKSYGELTVIDNLSVSFPPERVTAILGPSGCGKTTLLKIIAHLIKPDSGKIECSDGNISMVFQDPLLFPWRSVLENVEVVMPKAANKNDQKKTLMKILKILRIDKYKDFLPFQLSGGMKQRVSLARAFSYPASAILLDEPFRGLDLPLKISLIKDFEHLWNMESRTGIFVTHDVIESVMLGDEILIMTPCPTRIEKSFKNPVIHEERNPYHPDILELQKEIYQYILE